MNLDFLGGLTTYYLTGWYISNIEIDKKISTTFYIMGFLGLLSVILLTQLFPTQYNLTYSNNNILVYFYSLAIFLLVKNFYSPKKGTDKIFLIMSKLSFGVYLIHIFVLSVISKILLKNVFFIPVVWLITMIMCLLISFIISKIPFIKRMIKT